MVGGTPHGIGVQQRGWIGEKKRRVDPHLQQWVVQESVQSGQHTTSMEANKSLDRPAARSTLSDWKAKELNYMRCGMHVDFRDAEAVSLIYDGIRFGNPSEEYICAAVTDLARDRHAVLPPHARMFKREVGASFRQGRGGYT